MASKAEKEWNLEKKNDRNYRFIEISSFGGYSSQRYKKFAWVLYLERSRWSSINAGWLIKYGLDDDVFPLY